MTSPAPVPSPQAALMQMINGYWSTCTILAAVRVGVADHVAADARPVDELARELEVDADALFRLMRALAGLGVFAEGPARSFAHTPLSEALRQGVPGSMHGLAAMTGLMHLKVWPELAWSVRTGKPAFDHVLGKPIFAYVGENAEAGAAFDAAMAGYTAATCGAVAAGWDFSPYKTIVDVGGGNASLLALILQKTPGTVGINLELPASSARAKALIEARGLIDRCEVVAGDFFVSVPAGGDAYVLKSVLHDWDDARCLTILKNVRAAMKPGARLIVVEAVVDSANGAGAGTKLSDINMLAMTGGRERTAAELTALYRAAGFSMARIAPLPGGLSVIEGALA